MVLMYHPEIRIIAEKFTALGPVLDERARRLWAAAEARAIGRGGISRVAEATGLSRRGGRPNRHAGKPDRGATW